VERVLFVSIAAAGLILALAGCGGKQAEHSLTFDDVISIVGPPPDTPAGTSYLPNGTTDLSVSDLRDRTQSSDRAAVTTLEKAGLARIYQRSFSGAINVAHATAYLFQDPAGAGRGFSALRTSLTRQATPDRKLADVAADELGKESWGAHLSGGAEAALFVFRKSNIVVVADMSCDSRCGVDIVAAARTYADGIATRAAQVAG
jgi:hypothetical protein